MVYENCISIYNDIFNIYWNEKMIPNHSNTFDIIIIGGGPAGSAAAIYANKIGLDVHAGHGLTYKSAKILSKLNGV